MEGFATFVSPLVSITVYARPQVRSTIFHLLDLDTHLTPWRLRRRWCTARTLRTTSERAHQCFLGPSSVVSQQLKQPAERSQRQPPSSTYPSTPLRSSRSSGSCCAHQATLAEVVDSFTTLSRYATLLHAGSAGLGSRGARNSTALFHK